MGLVVELSVAEDREVGDRGWSCHGIHPFRATPRRKYYERRGWTWQE